MKTSLAALLVIFSVMAYEQGGSTNPIDNGLQKETSPLVLIKVHFGSKAPKTAYFLNGHFIKYTLLVSSNPELIESLDVIYKPIEIDSVKYEKQIRLTAKNNYFPKAISLTDLKNKYYPGSAKNLPAIFTIDDNIIHGDCDTYEIDENNLYAVTLDPKNPEDKVKFQFFKLTTKSEENIKNLKHENIWLEKDGIKLAK